MPRELAPIAKEDDLQGMPQLTKSPEQVDETGEGEGATGLHFGLGMGSEEDEEAMIAALAQKNEKRDELHPYTQTLKLSDVDSCVLLESETFPPHERCTREKVSSCCGSHLFFLDWIVVSTIVLPLCGLLVIPSVCAVFSFRGLHLIGQICLILNKGIQCTQGLSGRIIGTFGNL